MTCVLIKSVSLMSKHPWQGVIPNPKATPVHVMVPRLRIKGMARAVADLIRQTIEGNGLRPWYIPQEFGRTGEFVEAGGLLVDADGFMDTVDLIRLTIPHTSQETVWVVGKAPDQLGDSATMPAKDALWSIDSLGYASTSSPTTCAPSS
mmetsp:Transcript_28564/g.45503  ORF Transcript_28564/g.45503 Transcript_28564/m.45503 type:complete len:149 (-) Transcript_28564:69-515(-)